MPHPAHTSFHARQVETMAMIRFKGAAAAGLNLRTIDKQRSWIKLTFRWVTVPWYITTVMERVVRERRMYSADYNRVVDRLMQKHWSGKGRFPDSLYYYEACFVSVRDKYLFAEYLYDHEYSGVPYTEQRYDGQWAGVGYDLPHEIEAVSERAIRSARIEQWHFYRPKRKRFFSEVSWCRRCARLCRGERSHCLSCDAFLARVARWNEEVREIRSITNGLAKALKEKNRVQQDLENQRAALLPLRRDEEGGARRAVGA